MVKPSRKVFLQRKIDGEVFRYVFHTDTVWRLIPGHRWVNMSSDPQMGIHGGDLRGNGGAYYLVLTGGGFYRTFPLSPAQEKLYELCRERKGWYKDNPYMDEKGVIPPNIDAEFGRFD